MNDAISRQSAIDLVTDAEYMNFTAKGILRDRLRKLPLAQPEQQWIPCNKRMPDVGHRVLLSGHGMVMVGTLHSSGKYSLEPTGLSYVYPKDEIEAWMPLPGAYMGGAE